MTKQQVTENDDKYNEKQSKTSISDTEICTNQDNSSYIQNTSN